MPTDDLTRQVLAERWEIRTREVVGCDHRGIVETFTEILAGDELILVPETESAENRARARVASCAPEALTLLLDAEWRNEGEIAACRWCPAYAYREAKQDHAPDCRWLAIMKRAGLR